MARTTRTTRVYVPFTIEELAKFVCGLGPEKDFFTLVEYMTGEKMNPLRFADLKEECISCLLEQFLEDELYGIVGVADSLQHRLPDDPAPLELFYKWLELLNTAYGTMVPVKPLNRVENRATARMSA